MNTHSERLIKLRAPIFLKVFFFLTLFLSANPNAFSQVFSADSLKIYNVRPSQTDMAITMADTDSHYVCLNRTAVSQQKLVVFIGGTGSVPRYQKFFCWTAASLGFHVVNLSYPNTISGTESCAASPDSACFDAYRQEVVYGTPVSGAVSVDSVNCIYNRLTKLLMYLSTQYPVENWGQFLAGNQPKFSEIIVSGHSQGSGHAAYLAKTNLASRCIMFSGPNDFNVLLNKSAPWFGTSGMTPTNRYFGFLHLRDEIIPFVRQHAVFNALGMLVGDDTTDVDVQTSPFQNSKCLYTNAEPQIANQFHGSTVVDFYTPIQNGGLVFQPVWKYLLGVSTASSIEENPTRQTKSFSLGQNYPNPFNPATTITYFISQPSSVRLVIYDVLGKEVATLIDAKQAAGNYRVNFNASNFPSGVYLYRLSIGSSGVSSGSSGSRAGNFGETKKMMLIK